MEQQWQSIDTAPKNQDVLVGYHNEAGKWRTVKAAYLATHTVESFECDDAFAEYFEEEDAYYCPAGWYESLDEVSNSIDYGYYKMEHDPSHWMPLPGPPMIDQESPKT